MVCVGCPVIENKASLEKIMFNIHKSWYVPLQIQTCLEKYSCNIFVVNYVTMPTAYLWMNNPKTIPPLKAFIILAVVPHKFRSGEDAQIYDLVQKLEGELCYCELRCHCLFQPKPLSVVLHRQHLFYHFCIYTWKLENLKTYVYFRDKVIDRA